MSSIRSLVTARDLKYDCARVLNEALLVPVILCGSETMIGMEKERSTIGAVQMDNFSDLFGILSAECKNMRAVWSDEEGRDENINESILRWFNHIERIGNGRNAKTVYMGECVGSRLVGGPRKKWIDSVIECLKKNGA